MTSDLSFPVGRFQRPESPTDADRAASIDVLAQLPKNFRAAVAGLTDEQLDTPYRPGGWTVRQVVHHVPDSHMNALIRLKLGLTEDNPTIKPYDQTAWAKLEDARSTPIETSLSILDGVHDRMVRVLRSMKPADFSRMIQHPENGPMRLDDVLAMYAWHSRHHTAHVTGLRERMGW